MKELTIEEKAKRYDEAIETARKLNNGEGVPAPPNWTAYEVMFPELKESEDDKIRKELLEHCKNQAKPYIQTGNECPQIQSWIAWLEKQGEKDNLSIDFVLGYLGIKPAYKDGNAWCILLGDNIQEGICGFGDTKEEALIAFIKELIEKQGTLTKLSEEEQNRFAKGVLTSCASLFINYLDAHKYEGKMCVSNGECEDIENAFQNGMWDKLHRYYCKYIEKQSNNPQGKSALEAINKEKVDNQNCVKPVNRVEPKFKVGDWVVVVTSEGEKVVQINSIEYFKSGEPRYITSTGKWFGNGTEAHLWTIQDAKAGDILVDIYGNIGIFEERYGINWHTYCYIGNEGRFISEGGSHGSTCYPATKEQRDTLMKAMADAGYTFDFDKKESNKIEHKPVWSEDDKKMIDAAIQFAHEYGRHGLWCWLKSLKDRFI